LIQLNALSQGQSRGVFHLLRMPGLAEVGAASRSSLSKVKFERR
jgi:hypothetical protein